MNKTNLDVTVCVLSFNRPGYLCETVASILTQNKAPKDIIIFDNGSKPDVLASLEIFSPADFSWRGAEVTQSAPWNFRRAVAEVNSKYAIIMHDDDRLCPEFLDKQIEYLEKTPEVVAVSCNGYLIDENGARINDKLVSNYNGSEFEVFKCSGDVALLYASDRCIPMCPVIYRTHVLDQVDLCDEYEKVSDVVLFCDIAEIGTIALRSKPLYECRLHRGQDSSYFSPELMIKLENFLGTRKTKNEEDTIKLRRLLLRQHTSRNLRLFLKELKKGKSIKIVFNEFVRLWDGVFSPFVAVKVVTNYVLKRLRVIRIRS